MEENPMEKGKNGEKQYVKVPYAILDKDTFKWASLGKNINPDTTRLLYCALRSLRDKGSDRVRRSQKDIGDRIGLSSKQTARHLKRLSDLKIIRVMPDQFNVHGWNTYVFKIDETYYAKVPYHIMFEMNLSAAEIIAYCWFKRFTDTKKKDYVCYRDNGHLADDMDCTKDHVRKVKNMLMEKELIEFEGHSNKIVLIYEKNANSTGKEAKIAVKQTMLEGMKNELVGQVLYVEGR
jgi:hypothetical protein